MLVTVCCTTYNHAKFIKDALNGFVMQQTNFPFEIIISDDASTDGTVDILKSYAAQHSNIKLILNKQNRWKAGMLDGTFFGFEPLIHNILPVASGKYLAFCEGDDHWTDPLKLQKQVDYMESHPECSMTYHAYSILRDRVLVGYTDDQLGKSYSAKVLVTVPNGIISSAKMFRNYYSEDTKAAYQAFSGDYLLTSYYGLHGSCDYIPGIRPSVYRIHDQGVWMGLDKDVKKIRYNKMLEDLYATHLIHGTPESAEIRRQCLYNKETFGIVMPTYRRPDGKTPMLLARALDSVFAQTYQNFKVYLIGDKYENDQEVLNILARYPAGRIHYENLPRAIEREKYPERSRELWCSGGVNASNYAIAKANADRLQYVCFLDHDDKWLPNHLQVLHDTLKQTGAHWLCTDTIVNSVDHVPRISTSKPIIEFLPLSEGVIKSSVCFDIQYIPTRFRDVLAETNELFPADADLWRRMKEFIQKHGLKSYYLNTLTCIYISGGIRKPLANLTSWRPPDPSKPVHRPTWRDKLISTRSFNFQTI